MVNMMMAMIKMESMIEKWIERVGIWVITAEAKGKIRAWIEGIKAIKEAINQMQIAIIRKLIGMVDLNQHFKCILLKSKSDLLIEPLCKDKFLQLVDSQITHQQITISNNSKQKLQWLVTPNSIEINLLSKLQWYILKTRIFPITKAIIQAHLLLWLLTNHLNLDILPSNRISIMEPKIKIKQAWGSNNFSQQPEKAKFNA